MKLLRIALAAYGLYAYGNYRRQSPLDTSSSTVIDVGATLKGIMGTNNRTSQAGQDAIRQREGAVYVVYADQAGLLTAGIGHKLRPSDGGLVAGSSVSVDQVNAWFAQDIAHAENIVNYYVTAPLTQNQFDALVSATFNLGGAFFVNADGSQTHVLQYLNAGDYQSAAAQFPRWINVHVNGQAVPSAGLLARRESEMMQFLA